MERWKSSEINDKKIRKRRKWQITRDCSGLRYSERGAFRAERTLRSKTSRLPWLQLIWDLWRSEAHHRTLADDFQNTKEKVTSLEGGREWGREWGGRERQSVERQRRDGWRNIKAWSVNWEWYSEGGKKQPEKGRAVEKTRGNSVNEYQGEGYSPGVDMDEGGQEGGRGKVGREETVLKWGECAKER